MAPLRRWLLGDGSPRQRARRDVAFGALCIWINGRTCFNVLHNTEPIHLPNTAVWRPATRDAARWLFLGTLIYAPWAYGCTRPWTLHVLNGLLGIALAGWTVTCALRKQWPRMPPVLLVSGLLLAAQGGWMTLNGTTTWTDPASPLPTARSLTDALPGSLSRSLSWPATLTSILLLGAVGLASDLGGSSLWRKRVLWTLGATCASLAAWGLIQSWAGAPGIFWQADETAPTFFATYGYHANAGAFLNLGWPVIASLLMASLQKPHPIRLRVFWLVSLGLCLASVFINTSRGAHFVALLLIVIGLGWAARHIWRHRWPHTHPATAGIAVVLGLALLAGIASAIRIDRSLERWKHWQRELTEENSRYRASVTCLSMAPTAGAMGFGPGTFARVFAHRQATQPDAPQGTWEFAHNDYLQTVLEWGFIGTALWAVVLLGGPLLAVRQKLGPRNAWTPGDHALSAGALLGLLGVAVHAVADYPLQIASIQLYVATLVGLLWGSSRWQSRTRGTPTSNIQHPTSNIQHRTPNGWRMRT